jgi:hypothetical protein
VIVHNKIERQKKHHYRDEQGSLLLKVITLAREPIGWYLSNFSQNFPEYERDIEDWVRYSQIVGSVKVGPDKQRIIIEFINEVLRFFDENVQEIEGNTIQKLGALLDKNRAGYTEVTDVLVKHSIMLLRPICWFDQHFDPVMGTHFQEMCFDKDLGYSAFEKDGMDILVIRFEDLAEIGPKVIGDFLDIKNFKIKRDNISHEKEVGAIISSSVRYLNFSREFLEKIYKNTYCSKFYTEKHIDDFKKRYLGRS